MNFALFLWDLDTSNNVSASKSLVISSLLHLTYTTLQNKNQKRSASKPKDERPKNFSQGCILLSSDDSAIARGSKLGMAKISARLNVSYGADDTDPWMGVTLGFPLGDAQEHNCMTGFGVKYTCELPLFLSTTPISANMTPRGPK